MKVKGELLQEHFGTLIVGMILALFAAFISLAGVALLTWAQTEMNTIAIANNNVATAKAGESRFTKYDAERLDDIAREEHKETEEKLTKLREEIAFIKGQHLKE